MRMLLVMSLTLGWNTRQVDFSNAFVQADLNKHVYLTLPQYFESEEGLTSQEAVLKLNKSIYVLVQSFMYWFYFLSQKWNSFGFYTSNQEPCLFFGRGMIIVMYVDDCLFFGPDGTKIDKLIQELQDSGMKLTKEDEDVFHFLGVTVDQKSDGRIELLQQG